MLDATDAGAPGHQSFPQRGDTDAKRRYRPQTGHHDPFHDLSLSPVCPWTYRLGAQDQLFRTSAGRPRSVRLSVVTSRLMRRMSPESTLPGPTSIKVVAPLLTISATDRVQFTGRST